MARSKYLEYKDIFVTIFNDTDKCLLVFLTDDGKTQVVNYDDNFFYVECLLDTYLSMLEQCFRGWQNRELDKSDYEEIRKFLIKYCKHIKRQCIVDLDCLRKETRELITRG